MGPVALASYAAGDCERVEHDDCPGAHQAPGGPFWRDQVFFGVLVWLPFDGLFKDCFFEGQSFDA